VIEARQTRRFSEAVFNRLYDWQLPVFPLRGADLKSAGMTAGEAIGDALDRLEAIWVDSDFTLSRDDLLARL
jgi:poly(A) polymerase